jgi:hypothetical protein
MEYGNTEIQIYQREGSVVASSTAAEATTTASVHRKLIKPTRPTASQVNPEATLLSDLSNEDLKRWTIMKEHKEKAKALAELDNYIESTVHCSNHPIISDLTAPYKKLQALKKKPEPTAQQLRQTARAA